MAKTKRINGRTYYKVPQWQKSKKSAKKTAKGMKKRNEISRYRIKKVKNGKGYYIWVIPTGSNSVWG